MNAAAILERLQRDGLKVRADGQTIYLSPPAKVTPEMVELVRVNKPSILKALAEAPRRPVTCQTCSHFQAHPGEQPDGHCRRYDVEAWADVPFACAGYSAADQAARVLEHRCRKVEREFAEHPEQRVTADAVDAPLRPEPGAPVSVVIAVRTPAGIVSGELSVPRERFDAALFFRTLQDTSETPS